MSESRVPVRTIKDLAGLDPGEITEGYRDGYAGEPCGGNRSRAYWHGHRNGAVDARRADPDEHQRALAREVLQAEKMAGRA